MPSPCRGIFILCGALLGVVTVLTPVAFAQNAAEKPVFNVESFEFHWLLVGDGLERLSLVHVDGKTAFHVVRNGVVRSLTPDDAAAIGAALVEAEKHWQKLEGGGKAASESVTAGRHEVSFYYDPSLSWKFNVGVVTGEEKWGMMPAEVKTYGPQLAKARELVSFFDRKAAELSFQPAVKSSDAPPSPDAFVVERYRLVWSMLKTDDRRISVEITPKGAQVVFYAKGGFGFNLTPAEATIVSRAMAAAHERYKQVGDALTTETFTQGSVKVSSGISNGAAGSKLVVGVTVGGPGGGTGFNYYGDDVRLIAEKLQPVEMLTQECHRRAAAAIPSMAPVPKNPFEP